MNEYMTNLLLSIYGKFHISSSNRFVPAIILKVVISNLPMFDRYFNGHFWSNSLNMHLFVFSESRSVKVEISFLYSRHFQY